MERHRWLRWLATFFLVAIPLSVIGAYWFATSVEAYDVATRVIESDPEILAQIDEPKTYRLAFLNGYHYSTFGTSAKAQYRFVVAGDTAEGIVDLVLERHTGEWRLVEGVLSVEGGDQVDLEPRELK